MLLETRKEDEYRERKVRMSKVCQEIKKKYVNTAERIMKKHQRHGRMKKGSPAIGLPI